MDASAEEVHPAAGNGKFQYLHLFLSSCTLFLVVVIVVDCVMDGGCCCMSTISCSSIAPALLAQELSVRALCFWLLLLCLIVS